MKPNGIKPTSGKQGGIAAVELALVLALIGLVILPPLLFTGRLLWYYTVATKASHDATRFLSTVSVSDMSSTSRTGYAVDVAKQIVNAEMAELNLGGSWPAFTILCGNYSCDGLSVPSTVRVAVRFPVSDPVFQTVTEDDHVIITGDATMPFVGE
jgi:hypothetical protein